MSALDMLRGIATGDAAAYRNVLHNCRFEGLGTEGYGTEDIRALLRAAAPMARVTAELGGSTTAALFGADGAGRPAALFADLFEGRAMRLWLLGSRAHEAQPPLRTAVPVDPDLDQRGGRIAFEPADHPDLAGAGAEAVRDAVQPWLDDPAAPATRPLMRARPIVLRALSAGGRAAALVRVEGIVTGRGRAGFLAAVMTGDGESTTVIDEAGRAASLAASWAPILRTTG